MKSLVADSQVGVLLWYVALEGIKRLFYLLFLLLNFYMVLV